MAALFIVWVGHEAKQRFFYFYFFALLVFWLGCCCCSVAPPPCLPSFSSLLPLPDCFARLPTLCLSIYRRQGGGRSREMHACYCLLASYVAGPSNLLLAGCMNAMHNVATMFPGAHWLSRTQRAKYSMGKHSKRPHRPLMQPEGIPWDNRDLSKGLRKQASLTRRLKRPGERPSARARKACLGGLISQT